MEGVKFTHLLAWAAAFALRNGARALEANRVLIRLGRVDRDAVNRDVTVHFSVSTSVVRPRSADGSVVRKEKTAFLQLPPWHPAPKFQCVFAEVADCVGLLISTISAFTYLVIDHVVLVVPDRGRRCWC